MLFLFLIAVVGILLGDECVLFCVQSLVLYFLYMLRILLSEGGLGKALDTAVRTHRTSFCFLFKFETFASKYVNKWWVFVEEYPRRRNNKYGGGGGDCHVASCYAFSYLCQPVQLLYSLDYSLIAKLAFCFYRLGTSYFLIVTCSM